MVLYPGDGERYVPVELQAMCGDLVPCPCPAVGSWETDVRPAIWDRGSSRVGRPT